jgi:lauroyl/myristoyl acyltransferase
MAAESTRLTGVMPVGHQSRRLYRAAPFALGAALARVTPLPLLRLAARTAGVVYAWTHPRRVEVVRKNLRLLSPHFGAARARAVYGAFGGALADYFHIGTRTPAEAVKIISAQAGYKHLAAAHAAGKGALIVTAHLGLFELGGLLLAHHGYRSTVLTFPEPSAELTQWRAEFRRRWQVETIEIGDDRFAFLQIAQRLRRNEFIATLIDRPQGVESTPVLLPNGAAGFSAGILLLAAHLGTPVIPATMVRTGPAGYEARVFPPIFIRERETRAETLRFYTQQIADTFAPLLCAHPEQWFQFVPLTDAAA